ncbi:hypothetical protein D3C78_1519230 [compost metagenome]
MMVSGWPALVYSWVVWVTGLPAPVLASSPRNTALISVLLPTPVLPAIRMFTRPAPRVAVLMASAMASCKAGESGRRGGMGEARRQWIEQRYQMRLTFAPIARYLARLERRSGLIDKPGAWAGAPGS